MAIFSLPVISGPFRAFLMLEVLKKKKKNPANSNCIFVTTIKNDSTAYSKSQIKLPYKNWYQKFSKMLVFLGVGSSLCHSQNLFWSTFKVFCNSTFLNKWVSDFDYVQK